MKEILSSVCDLLRMTNGGRPSLSFRAQRRNLLFLLVLLLPARGAQGRERPFDDLYVFYCGRVTTVSTFRDCDYADLKQLRLFPVRDSAGTVEWYAAREELPQEVMDDFDRWVFIRKSLNMVEDAARKEDSEQVDYLIGKIRAYQEKVAGESLPTEAQVRAERLYNRIARPKVPFMIAITLGLLRFVLNGLSYSRGRPLPKGFPVAALAVAGLLLGYLTLVLGLSWYVSGHAPFAGTWCVMLLVAWFALLAVLVLGRRLPILLPSGLLLAGFTMLLSSLSFVDPQITPLVPALQSPLLSVHVLSMMLSYTLFGLAALGGALGLSVRPASVRLRQAGLYILCPAVSLLGIGIILGSVWASTAWGSWWSWDPKETWALITLIVYAILLACNRFLRKPIWFHLGTVLAFLLVLFTWFGVSYFLGGMHAYS